MADDLARVLEALNIDRTHLLATVDQMYMIGIEFALRHSDHLDRLVLTGPLGAGYEALFDPISTSNSSRPTTPAERSSAVRTAPPGCSPQPSTATRPRYRRRSLCWQAIQTRSSRGLRSSGSGVPGFRRPRPARRHRSAPGDCRSTQPAGPGLGRRGGRRIPGARFDTVTGDGPSHLVPLERPDRFSQFVIDFLT